MLFTEIDYCTHTGDVPNANKFTIHDRNPNPAILIPAMTLPAETPEWVAEHERAMCGAYSWSRGKDGRIYLWVEM